MNKVALSVIIALLISFSALAISPLAVFSQGAADTSDPVAIYKEAGINAEQESSIRKLALDYDQENAIRLKSLGELLHELRTLAYKPVLDENAMLAKQEQINKLQSEMAMERIKLVVKIRNILTPGQNEKLVSLLQSHMREDQEPGSK